MIGLRRYIRDHWPFSYSHGSIIVADNYPGDVFIDRTKYPCADRPSPDFIAAADKHETQLRGIKKSEEEISFTSQNAADAIAQIKEMYPCVYNYCKPRETYESGYLSPAIKLDTPDKVLNMRIYARDLNDGWWDETLHKLEKNLMLLDIYNTKCEYVLDTLPLPIAHKVVKWLYPI